MQLRLARRSGRIECLSNSLKRPGATEKPATRTGSCQSLGVYGDASKGSSPLRNQKTFRHTDYRLPILPFWGAESAS